MNNINKVLIAQNKLNHTDYKIIKTMEAVTKFLCEKFPELEMRLPYPLSIFDERQEQRNAINDAENQNEE